MRRLLRHGESTADKYRARAHFRTRLAPQPLHRHRREVGENHIVLCKVADSQILIPDAAPTHIAVVKAAQPDAQPTPQERQWSGFHTAVAPVRPGACKMRQYSAQPGA